MFRMKPESNRRGGGGGGGGDGGGMNFHGQSCPGRGGTPRRGKEWRWSPSDRIRTPPPPL